MNAFQKASLVEQEGMRILLPFISGHADRGHYTTTFKGKLAREFQRRAGDVLFNQEGAIVTCECKTERKYTGRLFIEVWSNRSRLTRGWLDHLQCDYLLYLFLDNRHLYPMRFDRLKSWCFGTEGPERLCKYPIVKQAKYEQLNDTWGRLVPIECLISDGITKEIRLDCLDDAETELVTAQGVLPFGE